MDSTTLSADDRTDCDMNSTGMGVRHYRRSRIHPSGQLQRGAVRDNPPGPGRHLHHNRAWQPARTSF
ncbi:hypothetical protein DPMN_100682 [Dreissena polymorpha]|uniref:Uncharacterized protein n=1 Tax=Dreissena polymorpha TaxID=45954 RepID=A0A9D4LI00_DREPO|nr:hypothetical protein DPMN_100589 [Dreissena polymorpha]KAH3858063.1 hypothetical protein DPMN_100682 [Dreissena polymorpha]